MKQIDLHTHSNVSDGTFSPAELVSIASAAGLTAFALTDHDTIAGVDEAIEVSKHISNSPSVIPGVELSVEYKERDIHIVGLFINQHDNNLINISKLIIKRRDDRNQEMAERLFKAGIPVTMDALKQYNPDTVVTRAHFARFMVENKIAKTPNEAFAKYLDISTPYYVPRKYISQADALALIRDAGGVPILAHPLHYHLEEKELEKLIESLSFNGLVGIEVKYSSHTRQDETYVKKLANRYQLLPSGGSDFHGTNKPAISVGSGRGNLCVPYEYLENLASVCNYPL